MRPRHSARGTWRAIAVVVVCAASLATAGCDSQPRSPDPAPADVPAAEDEPTAPPPGPTPIESPAEVAEFLTGKTFRSIPGRKDHWEFMETGVFKARLGRAVWVGRWDVGALGLKLTKRTRSLLGAMPARQPDAVVPLRMLDGKLNIEIDGRQYRVD